MTPQGQAAAHALLDALVANDPASDEAANAAAMALALRSLEESGAVSTSLDAAGQVTLDASGLIEGSEVLVSFLIGQIALLVNQEQESVIARVRDWLASFAA